ncbi:hypothetical protein D9757_009232 [Collybiopsis confluens]|uniref:F-box domain-containing protein n=1 Tax=Collybiopsis confluens TaxID=2823264 RepID=A0A8H5HAV2_9AGAR|nr:hypothetical protein D9757_009232 [Collybiopsis confluens]
MDSPITHLSSPAIEPGLKRLRNSDDIVATEPLSKRKRTMSGVGPRRKTKALLRTGIIQHLPLELIFEILYHLQPYDLLRLSRTSKGFRNVLMHNSSQFLWRQARANVEPIVPALPFDLSEPAYAHLLFYTYCTTLRESHVGVPCALLQKVLQEQVSKLSMLGYGTERLTEMSSRFIPNNHEVRARSINLLQSDRILAVIPQAASGDSFRSHLYIDALDNLITEALNIGIGNDQAVEEWISYKAAQYETVKKHAAECASWEKNRKYLQERERLAARQRRCEWIEERAVAEGWDEEIKSFQSLSRFPFVITHAACLPGINKKDKHSLIDSGKSFPPRRMRQTLNTLSLDWLKIKPALIPRLQAQRSELISNALFRRLRILEKIYSKFCSFYCKGTQKLPSLGDILTSPGPIRRILETTTVPRLSSYSPSVNIGNIGPVKVEEVETIWLIWRTLSGPDFAAFMNKCKDQKEQELFHIFRDSATGLNGNTASPIPDLQPTDLHLATTVFRCNAYTCGKNLYYDEALRHSCTTKYDFQEWAQASPTSTLPSPRTPSPGTQENPCIIVIRGVSFDCCEILKVKPWNHGGNRISFNHRASEVARRVLVQDRYLKPSCTTIHQIRRYNPRISCNTCFWTTGHNNSYWDDLFRHEDLKTHNPVIDWAGRMTPHRWSQIQLGLPDTPSSPQSPDTPTSSSSSLDEWVYGSRCGHCDELLHPTVVSDHLLSK